jgi:hypothetical protein
MRVAACCQVRRARGWSGSEPSASVRSASTTPSYESACTSAPRPPAAPPSACPPACRTRSTPRTQRRQAARPARSAHPPADATAESAGTSRPDPWRHTGSRRATGDPGSAESRDDDQLHQTPDDLLTDGPRSGHDNPQSRVSPGDRASPPQGERLTDLGAAPPARRRAASMQRDSGVCRATPRRSRLLPPAAQRRSPVQRMTTVTVQPGGFERFGLAERADVRAS